MPYSCHPVELTSVSVVEAFLADTPFACRSITELTGGTVNYVYRIHLLIPFEGEETVVLKHAQPFSKTSVTFSWEVERQMFEIEAMSRVRSCLSSDSPVKVPRIHHFDAFNNLIVMEDCGTDVVTLREFLRSGRASSMDIAETIGSSLGEFVAIVHEWSRSNPDGILEIFDKALHAKKIATKVNYDPIVPTLQRSDLDDPLNIQIISKLADEYTSQLMSALVPGRDVFLMGDLWDENILVSTDQHRLRLYILDWELARSGLPGSDIGLFCANMSLLASGNQSAPASSVILQNFLDAYSSISSRDDRLAQDTLVHWGAHYILWMPRDLLGDTELVQEFAREGVEFVVHSRDTGYIARSPVKGLLPN